MASKETGLISPTSRKTRHRWTPPEEKVLVSAWLNTSKDAVVENEQKEGTFWQRVAAYYAANPSVSNFPIRESNTCKQKWSKMNESVSRFASFYNYASRQCRNGETKDDILELTHKLYFQDQKVKFTLEHVWRLLKNDKKWCSLFNEKSIHVTKKSKGPIVVYSSSSNIACQVEGETVEKSMGVKAAKDKKQKKRKQMTEDSEDSSVRDLEQLGVIKDKDLVIKERLSKQKLLNSLIAKSGPLSEIEETLKNKLITEML